jgi:malate dehydrogenase (oxaloacetate-decarboxylating)(NADP+)
MHDDQHGTAIISAAALLNALEIQKKIEKAKFIVNALAPPPWRALLYEALGAKRKLFDVDRKCAAQRKNGPRDETQVCKRKK